MVVIRKYFPDTIPDNEEMYFSHIKGILESVDELSSLQISKLSSGYHFRISASIPTYNNMLIKEITKFHNILGIKLDFSKSIKSSGTLSFHINLNNN